MTVREETPPPSSGTPIADAIRQAIASHSSPHIGRGFHEGQRGYIVYEPYLPFIIAQIGHAAVEGATNSIESTAEDRNKVASWAARSARADWFPEKEVAAILRDFARISVECGFLKSERNGLWDIVKAQGEEISALKGRIAELEGAAPDWYMRAIDPDDAGDSAYQAMFSYSARLTPDELMTSYHGPTLWGVMSPPLPDADSDDETAHVFSTKEEAAEFCKERREILEKAGWAE